MSERIDIAFDYDWVGKDRCPSSEGQTIILGPEPWHRPRKGLLANEVPFQPDLRLSQPEIIAEHLRLPLARNCALQALLANLFYARVRPTDTRVFYSRDKNYYAGLSRAARYIPTFYTYAKMISGVASLEAAGLIEHSKTAPSPSTCLRSRINASPSLLSQTADILFDLAFKSKEVIVLRDADGWPLAYPESDRILETRRDAIEQNAFLASLDIRVDHPEARFDAHGFLHVCGRWLDPRRCFLYRVFNRKFTYGGRWYGAFWQSLPKDVRSHLLIDGEPVVELDYRACHLRLLCAVAGIDLPFHEEDFDPYQIAGFERSHAKRSFHFMVNAPTERKALGAIAQELLQRKIGEPHLRALSLMQAVRDQFPGLDRFWCSGVGPRLQNIDAEISKRVQRRLRRGPMSKPTPL